jgi:FkbM family methyltransferase
VLKDIIYKTISAVGYRCTPRAYSEGLPLASHLRKLFSDLDISTVIDVGANEGQYRNFLRRRCGFTGLIISFEPVKSVFDIIKARTKTDPRWIAYNFALGPIAEKKRFNVMADTRFSSFLTPSQDDIGKDDIKKKNVVIRTEEVEIRTLADILKEIGPRSDLGKIYLKLDTQGYDFEVLDGGRSAFNSIYALQIELPVKPLYKGMVSFSMGVTELGKYGFDITGIFPVTQDRLNRVIEFDCVAVRAADRERRPEASQL